MINNLKEKYKQYRDSCGRRIFFFIFYAIFFLILFIAIGSNSGYISSTTNNTTEGEYKENNPIVDDSTIFKTSNIDNQFYKYKITIQNNYDLQLLEGDFNNLTSIDNYKYKELLEITNIKKMIKNAKYISKNQYSTNQYKINYELTNYDLYRMFQTKELTDDMKTLINHLVVITDNNSEIIGFEYDFSNYLKSLEENIKIYKVIIEYEFEK